MDTLQELYTRAMVEISYALRPKKGQGMVEYALILVPLMLLTFGVFDLGRAVFYQHMLSNAAREGARAGVVAARSADEVCARAIAAVLLPDVPASGRCGAAGSLTVAVPRRGTPGAPADPLRVTLSYAFRPATPLVGRIVGETVVISASSTMYVER